MLAFFTFSTYTCRHLHRGQGRRFRPQPGGVHGSDGEAAVRLQVAQEGGAAAQQGAGGGPGKQLQVRRGQRRAFNQGAGVPKGVKTNTYSSLSSIQAFWRTVVFVVVVFAIIAVAVVDVATRPWLVDAVKLCSTTVFCFVNFLYSIHVLQLGVRRCQDKVLLLLHISPQGIREMCFLFLVSICQLCYEFCRMHACLVVTFFAATTTTV